MYALGISKKWHNRVRQLRKNHQRHSELKYSHHQRKLRSPLNLYLHPLRRRAQTLVWGEKAPYITPNPLACNFIPRRFMKRGLERQTSSTLVTPMTHRRINHQPSRKPLPSIKIIKGSNSSRRKKFHRAPLRAWHPPPSAEGRTDRSQFGKLRPPQI